MEDNLPWTISARICICSDDQTHSDPQVSLRYHRELQRSHLLPSAFQHRLTVGICGFGRNMKPNKVVARRQAVCCEV